MGLAWVNRSFGIHYDENNYLQFSLTRPYGDADVLAKSFLFYFINFVFNTGLGWLLGSLRPVTLYLVYGCLNVTALAWLAQSFKAPPEKRLAFFGIVLLSPLFLFNTIQVMMETPMLGLVALVFGSLLRLEDTDRAWLKWTAFAAAFLAVGIKSTGVFPVLILGLVFGSRQWKRAISPVAGIVGALLLYQFQVAILHTPSGNFGSVNQDVNLERVLDRVRETGAYFGMWLFYVSPALLLGALYGLRTRPQPEDNRRYWLMAGLSLGATLVIQVHSLLSFARYTYPSVWLGSVCVAWLAVQAVPARWAVLLALIVAVPSVNMGSGTDSRLSLWPHLISDESYFSGYTVLPGPRLFQWVLFAGEKRNFPCFYVPEETSIASIRQFMSFVTRNPRFFDKGHQPEFASCRGAHGVIERQPRASPAEKCVNACDPTSYAHVTCTVQDIRYPVTEESPLMNRTCLP